MDTDGLARAVREQLGIGRLLPLGTAADGCWLTERAAGDRLRAAAAGLPGVVVTGLRVDLRTAAPGPSRPLPPGALPPGLLRLTAECAMGWDAPVPQQARRLRAALGAAAAGLGLALSEIDVHVARLHDDAPTAPAAGAGAGPEGASGEVAPASTHRADGPGGGTAGDRIGAAVLAVPGVLRLAPLPGVAARGVRGTEGGVWLELAVDGAGPVLATALKARTAAAQAAGPRGADDVTVLVTALR